LLMLEQSSSNLKVKLVKFDKGEVVGKVFYEKVGQLLKFVFISTTSLLPKVQLDKFRTGNVFLLFYSNLKFGESFHMLASYGHDDSDEVSHDKVSVVLMIQHSDYQKITDPFHLMSKYEIMPLESLLQHQRIYEALCCSDGDGGEYVLPFMKNMLLTNQVPAQSTIMDPSADDQKIRNISINDEDDDEDDVKLNEDYLNLNDPQNKAGDEDMLVVGTVVEITGLTQCSHLNGNHCRILSYNLTNKRYIAEVVDGSGEGQFKRENLIISPLPQTLIPSSTHEAHQTSHEMHDDDVVDDDAVTPNEELSHDLIARSAYAASKELNKSQTVALRHFTTNTRAGITLVQVYMEYNIACQQNDIPDTDSFLFITENTYHFIY
jgi:hypothetical protein